MRRLRLRSGGHGRGSDERGVSLIFITLSMVMLMGFAAFAIDTGALYQERRTLQVGADAAVIAIAEDCARSLPCSQGVADATAGTYADLNADDGDHNIDTVDMDFVNQTVRVVTSTAAGGGGTLLKPFFAQVLGFSGTNVTAEAKANWGYLGGAVTLPLIMSFCEYMRPPAHGDSGNLMKWEDWDETAGVDPVHPPTAPGPPVPGTSYGVTLIKFHTGAAGEAQPDCAAVAGHDIDLDGRLPGGFGWLDPVGSSCSADISVGDWVDEKPGVASPVECDATWFKNNVLNKLVFLPYFEDTNNLGGANGQYEVAGFAAIYVTGYRFPGGPWSEPSPAPCNGPVHCIEGYFFEATNPDGTGGGPNTGVSVFGFIP